MPVTVSLPDGILSDQSEDVSRKVLEQVALEGFKTGQLTIATCMTYGPFKSSRVTRM